MKNNTYQEAINILTSQAKFHINLGLSRTTKMLNLLNNPQDKLKIIHAAGTNGKGSTCALLSNILTIAGYKCGLFTSPHIFEYTERIKINNSDISKNDFAKIIKELCNLAEHNNIELTEFEILTIGAFKYFTDNNVDIVVLETGLGGRLDSTNIISTNLCAIITSLSLDHTDRLGETIEQITFEKASIIKENSPVIVSEKNKGFEVISKFAKTKNSKILPAERNIELKFENNTNYIVVNNKKYEFNLLGLYQKENVALVLAAVKYLRETGYTISETDLENAFKTVKWSARFQYIKEKSLIIDAAHNPDAAKVLRSSLDYYFPERKRIWIYGSLGTKDYKEIMDTLFMPEDDINLYKFDFKNAVNPVELSKQTKLKTKTISLHKINDLINHSDSDALIIITGSFYMLDEILKSIAIQL